MKTYARLLSLVAMSLLTTGSALAQDSQRWGNSKPLTGQVQVQVGSDPETRIRRTSLRPLQAPLNSSVAADAYGQRPLSSSVSAGAFSQPPMGEQVPMYAPIYRPPYTARARQTVLQASAQKKTGAPYIWAQSKFGGYYDESGTTQEVVPANRLYMYGGRFKDGSPVPSSQIESSNFAGHAFKQPRLNTDYFWNR